TTLRRVARRGLLAKARYPDGKMVDNSERRLVVERDQRAIVAKSDDPERLVLADDNESEHFLIELGGALQVRDLDADVIDVSRLEVEILLGGGAGCARRQHGKPGNQLASAERAFFETVQKIGYDRFHGGILMFGKLLLSTCSLQRFHCRSLGGRSLRTASRRLISSCAAFTLSL